MKLRALGAGNISCRHPLTTSSFLIQAEGARIVIGCGAGIPSKLESINIDPTDIDIWIPLGLGLDQWSGLEEVAYIVGKKRPYIAAPQPVTDYIGRHLRNRFGGRCPLALKPTQRIFIQEEHHEEVLTFVQNYGLTDSYGISMEQSLIFISGDTELNDEWLHANGAPVRLIQHSCRLGPSTGVAGENASIEELQQLPIYLQKKIWLYGYDNRYQQLEAPLPMLFLPQGQQIYDSERRDKYLEKERFIRENTKRQAGNQLSKDRLQPASDS